MDNSVGPARFPLRPKVKSKRSTGPYLFDVVNGIDSNQIISDLSDRCETDN